MSAFESYLAELPLLHTWDRGATWNTGGFSVQGLRQLHTIVRENVSSSNPAVVETGAGNSTITFLHLTPKRLVSFAPDSALRDRIVDYCTTHDLDSTALDYRCERSETALPRLALDEQATFDVGLIDGGHGWPTVFVDFCYVNMMLRKGGLLILDDLQLHSVAELARLLDSQPEFAACGPRSKFQAWVKETDRPLLDGHGQQPYIVAMSEKPPGDEATTKESVPQRPERPDAATVARREARRFARRVKNRVLR